MTRIPVLTSAFSQVMLMGAEIKNDPRQKKAFLHLVAEVAETAASAEFTEAPEPVSTREELEQLYQVISAAAEAKLAEATDEIEKEVWDILLDGVATFKLRAQLAYFPPAGSVSADELLTDSEIELKDLIDKIYGEIDATTQSTGIDVSLDEESLKDESEEG